MATEPSVVQSEPIAPSEEVLKQVETKVRGELQEQFAKEVADHLGKMDAQNKEMLDGVIEKWKKEQAPPDAEDIKKLLEQEYVSFDVKVPWIVADENNLNEPADGTRTFVIKELPQVLEKMYYKTIRNGLGSKTELLTKLIKEYKDAKGQISAKQVIDLMDIFEPVFDLLADAVVMILNPGAKVKEINRQWVQENLSSYRIWNIVYAQWEVNKLRDFFSALSQGSGPMGRVFPVDSQR